MLNKIVTLYIDDASIRLLVTSGKKVKKWADVPLPPGLVKNSVIIREAEVATRIQQIFKAQKVRKKKVIVGMSGLHCLSRPMTLPQLPREMLEEAVRREAKRLLPVPLEQLYLSWQPIPSPEGKIQVFAVAIPVKAADSLFRTLHQAGLKSYMMDIKPMLLARLVQQPTAILVDVQQSEFDILILSDGIPQPIRTVSLPGESLVWQEKLSLILSEIKRTITFFNTNNAEKQLGASVLVFACGALADEPELCQQASAELKQPVQILPPPLECPGGLNPNRFMVSLAMAYKELFAQKTPAALSPNLNILPVSYRPKSVSLVRVLVPPAAAIVIGAVALLVMLIQSASADVSQLQGELNNTTHLIQQRLTQTQELKSKVAELDKKIKDAEVSGKNFINAVAGINAEKEEVNGNLKVVVESLPAGVQLAYVNHAEGKLVLQGSAPTEAEVLEYVAALDASDRFLEVLVTNLTRQETGGMEFTLALTAEEVTTK